MSQIAYSEGYDYQLEADYSINIPIFPLTDIITPFIHLNTSGTLLIRYGYAWDGASGPAIDTKSIMRASLVHDALYQLMRQGHLDPEVWRRTADKVFQGIYKEDADKVYEQGGFFTKLIHPIRKLRKNWIYDGVRIGGSSSADPSNDRKVMFAP